MPLEGSREGAPDAIQVADRFHLWQNLCEAVEKTVISCRAELREPLPEPGDPEPAGPGSDIPAGTTGPAAGQVTGHGRLATRSRERHAAIHDLLAQGNKSGYNFVWTGDGVTPSVAFVVSGAPQVIGSSGQRMFCTDQSGIIHYDPTGSGCTSASLVLQ